MLFVSGISSGLILQHFPCIKHVVAPFNSPFEPIHLTQRIASPTFMGSYSVTSPSSNFGCASHCTPCILSSIASSQLSWCDACQCHTLKCGGTLVFSILYLDPLWLSSTKEIREDKIAIASSNSKPFSQGWQWAKLKRATCSYQEVDFVMGLSSSMRI